MEKIIWSSWAVKDASIIYQYISMDSRYYAAQLLDKINDKVSVLSTHPHIGRVVPERKNPNIREIIEGNYRIMYRISGKHILICRIIHSSRNFK
jgi:toxin ParE1/3/4